MHVTNCAKRSVLVCLVTMLVFLLRLYGDSLGWDLLKISVYKGLPGEIFEINLIHALSLRSCFDYKHGLTPLEKRKFFDYLKMTFYTVKSVLFYLEPNQTIYLGLFEKKYIF